MQGSSVLLQTLKDESRITQISLSLNHTLIQSFDPMEHQLDRIERQLIDLTSLVLLLSLQRNQQRAEKSHMQRQQYWNALLIMEK